MAGTKRKLYFEKAERLYVIDQYTVLDVANSLPISEQTVRNWSKEGRWEEKRKEFIKTKDAFDLELYETARMISKKIREDLEDGSNISPSRFYTLARILEVIPKAKKYEKEKNKQDAEAQSEPSSLQELIEAIHKSLIGGR